MLKNVSCWLALSIICVGCACPRAQRSCPLSGNVCKKASPMLRHVVLFRFKQGTSPEKIRELEQAIAALPDKIGVIHCLEWGTNVSTDDRSDGFSLCFLMYFESEADRDTYLQRPEHKALGPRFDPIIDKMLVMDYLPQH